MRPPRRILIVLLLGVCGWMAPGAQAALTPDQDCNAHLKLTQHYSTAQLQHGLATMPPDEAEYTDCPTVIQTQINAQIGKGGGKGGGGESSGGSSGVPAILIIVLILVILGGTGATVVARRRSQGGDGEAPPPPQ